MLYKLTKGTLSVIRYNQQQVEQAKADGYKLDGEVNQKYEVINPYPVFRDEEIDELAELREKAVKLGLAPSTASRLKTEKALLKNIKELEEKAEEEKEV